MPRIRSAGLLMMASLFLMTASCTATRIAQSWVNPRGERPASVMVFGVTREESLRRTYEDTLSAALTAQGLTAKPSYNITKAHGEVTPEEAVAAVRRAGVDSVLITRLVRLAKEVEAVPDISPGPAFGYWGMSPYYSPLWPSYYYNSYRLIEHEAAYIESNLYKADSSALLLSILTRTEDPTYSTKQVQELVKVITAEFRRAGFLAERASAVAGPAR